MNIKNVIIGASLVLVCGLLFYQQSTAQDLKKQVVKQEQTITQLEKKVEDKETYIEELPEVQAGKQEKTGQAFNEQFLEAYFTYKDLETREAFSVPMLTKACNEELKLSVYDKDFPAKSYLVSHESYYASDNENELVSLNTVEVTTIMNQVQTTTTSTYRINLKKIGGNWLIDYVEFLGSQVK
ncbi:hypothetical protein EY653_05480 [Enterococcus faecalis]|uniref:hypothetical protein n=1 Tax=Enterococcus faecalis TaxID=1351 RepID=UPI001AD65191|nr:hypothetical protein [Enterococcus faecalis]MBO6438764.1 hypothetical protein [Enterococcus faecalis]MBO6453347.1 hypothetical protein [Enterococcus faecalis]